MGDFTPQRRSGAPEPAFPQKGTRPGREGRFRKGAEAVRELGLIREGMKAVFTQKVYDLFLLHEGQARDRHGSGRSPARR